MRLWGAGLGIGMKDIVSGLVMPIVIMTSTLSYVALIFSGPLAGSLPQGLGFGLISAGVMGIVFALAGSLPFTVAGPESKPTAVFAAMAAALAGATTGQANQGMIVLTALVAGTMVTGLALLLLGVFRTGRWIRFIPYPIVGGFMAASGWSLFAGGIRILAGVNLFSFETIRHLFEHGIDLVVFFQLMAGIALATALQLARHSRNPFVTPAILLTGTGLIHAALAASGSNLAEARAAGWMVDAASGAVLSNPLLSAEAVREALPAMLSLGGSYAVLIAVTATTLLLSLMAIEVETRTDVDVDRELRVNGAANLVVGLFGGMAGTLSASRTLFNFHSGARGPAAGVMAGCVCLATLAFGSQVLGFIPVAVLGGILLQMGLSLVEKWLVKGWRQMETVEYLQMAIILLVILRWGFAAGIGVGVMTASITFTVNIGRIPPVKFGLSRSNFASRVDRPLSQQEALTDNGNRVQIMCLQGFVFFGSANRLLLHIKRLIAAEGRGVVRFVLLDFRRVLGIDGSAVVTLVKLRHLAEREGFEIAVADIPPQVSQSLKVGGFYGMEGDTLVRSFPDLDAAVEWAEEAVLVQSLSRVGALRSADEWLTHEMGSTEIFKRLVSYLELIDLHPGEFVFDQGAPGDSLYLLYAGRVSILLRTAENSELRLRSMLHHTLIGEMGLYRGQPRGASVRVDAPTIVYCLTGEALAHMEVADPMVASAFHKFVIRTLASRLDFANCQIAALQR